MYPVVTAITCSVYAPPPPASRDEAVKVDVAISVPWLHVVTQRTVKGVGKQDREKTDKTTRTSPEIRGAGRGGSKSSTEQN